MYGNTNEPIKVCDEISQEDAIIEVERVGKQGIDSVHHRTLL